MPGGQDVGSGEHIWSRRDILSLGAWGAIITCLNVAGLTILRMMYPRVLFEPPTAFKAGFPNEYQVGEVSEKYMKDQRVWIIREDRGFYALIAICTHLGCTPRYFSAEEKFKCPCHGSGYTKDGINFEGPTPRPLERAKIGLADDGQLLVDKGVSFRYELGQWDAPDSYLKTA